jgi:hypothetical protein
VRVRTEIPADEIRARLQEELVRLEEELARRGGGVEGR